MTQETELLIPEHYFKGIDERHGCRVTRDFVPVPRFSQLATLQFEISAFCRKFGVDRLSKIHHLKEMFVETLLEKRSMEICSRLRDMFKLPEAKGEPNALADLDGFLADIASGGTDSCELVRQARGRE